MKLKLKLITTCIAFCMILCFTIVGVWAVVSPKEVNFGGGVGYDVVDVQATVTGSVTGASSNPTLSEIKFDANNSNPDVSSWSGWQLNFNEDTKQDITITINITNDSTEDALKAKLTTETGHSLTNINMSCKSKLGNETETDYIIGTTGEIEIAKAVDSSNKTTLTLTITLSIDDANISANGSLSFKLTLTNAGSTDSGVESGEASGAE